MSFFTNLKLSVRLSNRDVAALLELVTISEDFLAAHGDLVRHLYVEDGFLDAQDDTAARIEDWNAEADEALDTLGPRLERDAAQATFAEASTQQTSASTQEIAASAQQLARTAEQLERLVSHFRVA